MKFKQRIHNLYNNLGPAGQSIVAYSYSLFPLRLRKKRGFWGFLKFLRNSQWKSSEWHREYQCLQLQSLAKFAVSTTYYYQKLFEKNQIYPAQISTPDDLLIVPILQKSTLVKKLSEFLPQAYPAKSLITNSTSGSTGEPFKFFQDYSSVMREEAFAVRHWENAGMKLGEPCVYLRSYVPQNENETYYFDPVNNRHYFSAYHLDEKNLEFYCKKITDSKARFIFGYPSSLEILSDYLISSGKSLNFKAAITGSEMLSQTARRKIEEAFNTKVYDWYGLAEPAITMGQCEQGNYHLFAEYGILELLDAKNNPVTQEGHTGRIIATNFTNWALPLIRYDTGDLGTYTAKKCECGRGLPAFVSSILGRKDDLLVGSNGQYLPSVNFYSLFAKMGGEVSRFQLIQNEAARFKLKLVRGPEFSENSVKNIVKGLNQRIGGHPQIAIETVEKISPSQAGKIRAVIRDYDSIGQTGEYDEN